MSAFRLREAKSSDAASLGALHVASWRETYAGILPAQLLGGLSVEARSTMWGAVLENRTSSGGTAVLVVESDGEIVGFGACGAQRDEALKEQGFDGEIGAIYVLRSNQRAGMGGALMRLMARRLLDQGHRSASLWVLRENLPARKFYERLGGAIVGEKNDERAGVILTEMAYGWSDLSAMVR